MGCVEVLHDILTALAEEAAALACIARPDGQQGKRKAVVWERAELCTAADIYTCDHFSGLSTPHLATGRKLLQSFL